MPNKIEMIGKKFSNLTVVSEGDRGKKGDILWNCKCECGRVKQINGHSLRKGLSKSCGCLKMKANGLSTHPIYRVWVRMKERCLSPNNKKYKDYGGRGIKICQRWMSFKNFYEDMFQSYRRGLSLDRMDNDGDYNRVNCRWSTPQEQNKNKRSNIMHNGKTITEISKELGGTYRLVSTRLKRGWTMEKATTTPSRRAKNEF